MYNHQVEYKTLAWSLKKLAVSVFSLLRQSLDSKSQVCRVFPLETRLEGKTINKLRHYMSQFYSSNRFILLLNQFWQGWIKVTFIITVNGTQFLCFSLPCVWHTDPVHPCVHVQTALPVDDCAQVPPFKQGFGLQGLLVATIPGRC